VTHFKFLGPNYISGTVKARVVTFCTQVGYTKPSVSLKPRLHDTTGCQTGCQTGRLYRVYKHSTGCQTRLTTGLTNGCIMYTAGCQTGCTTRFDNRLDVCSHDTAGCQTRCTTGVTTGCIV